MFPFFVFSSAFLLVTMQEHFSYRVSKNKEVIE